VAESSQCQKGQKRGEIQLIHGRGRRLETTVGINEEEIYSPRQTVNQGRALAISEKLEQYSKKVKGRKSRNDSWAHEGKIKIDEDTRVGAEIINQEGR